MCLGHDSCLANSQKHRVFKTIPAKKRFYVIPGRGGGALFGWVCAARDSKLAPRSKKNPPLWNVQKSLPYFTPIWNKFLPQFHRLKMIKIQNNTKVKVRRTAIMIIMKAFYYFIIETKTCQRLVDNLKLNPLSAQIIIYCLMTNRMLALLERHASWNASCSEVMTVWHMTEEGDAFIFPIFSRKIEEDSARRVTSLPLLPINPEAHPAPRQRARSRPSYRKIGDCEQSNKRPAPRPFSSAPNTQK